MLFREVIASQIAGSVNITQLGYVKMDEKAFSKEAALNRKLTSFLG